MASKIPSLASVGDAERKEALAPIGRHEVKAKELKCTANSISRTNECTKEGFFRNEDDCTKFYRCVDSGYVFFEY